MKKVLVIVGSLACLFLVVFGMKTSGSTSEVDAVAQQYWDRMGKQCGDSYYVKVSASSLSMWLTGSLVPGRRGLTEFKRAVHLQKENDLTDAEKLNGFEWSGRTWFFTSMYREWNAGHWSQWQDGHWLSTGSSAAFFKKNGHWFYGDYRGVPIGSFRFPETVNCADIPK